MQFVLKETNQAEGGVVSISLNRPELHNAFNPVMIQELTDCFQEISGDSSVKAVLLRGNGKSFCAGADLEWMKSMKNFSLEENQQDSLQLFDMFKAIYDCPVPVIGQVHGNVFGGGLGLVAACDIAATEEDTQFCFSEAKLGLVPAVISPFVSEKCRPNKVLEWMLTAKVFKAKEALRGGLVHFRGDSKEVESFVQEQLQMIVKNGRQAVIETKALLKKNRAMDWDERRQETTKVIAARRVSAEGQEGLSAFLEKRKPSWVGQ